jgi:AraC-like DNA-binding protein
LITENLIAVKWHRYYKRDQFISKHFQHSEWVLFIIDKGLCSYNINGITGTAGRGDFLIIPARQPIEQIMLEPMRFHFVAFDWLDGRGDDPSSFLQILQEVPSLKISLIDSERFISTSEQLRKIAALGPQSIDKRFADHYVNDLWLLGRLELRDAEHSQKLREDELMEHAKKNIEDLAYQPLVLKDVAAAHFLSGVQFSRRFQAAFGISPIDYLTSVRLEKARSLLEESETTIEHIAQQCGYESRNYFCRIFTKHMKLSPSHYRRIHRV